MTKKEVKEAKKTIADLIESWNIDWADVRPIEEFQKEEEEKEFNA